MRVPVSNTQQHQQLNDPLKPNVTAPAATALPATAAANNNNNSLRLCSYEPTSVLDLRSPVSSSDLKAPPPGPAASSDLTSAALPPSHGRAWADDEDGGHHAALQSLDWDSIMKDLDLHEDVSAPTPAAPDSAHFVNASSDFADVYSSGFIHGPGGGFELGGGDAVGGGNWGMGFDFLEELIQASDCVDSGELQMAQVILARLNHRLRSPVGKPLHRAGFFFKEALHSLLLSASNSNRSPPQLSNWPDIVQTIKAYKAFSGISPISMFSHFTANQALLETLDGSPILHIVDFDIGLGGQYASLMREIADRACGSHAPALRVTAVVAEEYAVETRLVRENLGQFARDLNLQFSIGFVLNRAFDVLLFKAIKFVDGEALAVHVASGTLHRLGSAGNIGRFLGEARRMSPKVVVFVDNEPWWGMCSSAGGASGSFRRNFVSCLEHFSTVFESIDAAAGCSGGTGNGGGGDWPRKIETYLMQPRITAAVEAAATEAKRGGVPPGREVFQAAGMRAVQLSQFADYQAECLLGKVQVRGFHVAKRQAELVLCWHERALVATSAWKF